MINRPSLIAFIATLAAVSSLPAIAANDIEANARKLKSVVEAMQSKNWKDCYAKAASSKLTTLQDHAQWLKWECAQKLLEANPESGVTLEQLRLMSSETALLETKDPGSPYLKDALRLNVAFDQAIAHRLVKQGKRLAAFQAYEKVLLRILQSVSSGLGSSVAHIPSQTVSDFVDVLPKLIKARQLSPEIANAWILRLINLFPRKAKESELLGQKYPELAALAKAAPAFEKFSQTFKAPDPDFDLFDQGWKYFLDSKTSSAREKWEELLLRYPKSSQRFRTLFWIGESWFREHSEDKAKEKWNLILTEGPLTYYAILAFQRLKALIPEITFEPKASEPAIQLRDPYLTPLELRRLVRTETLLKVGTLLLAQREAAGLTPRESLSSEYLFGLAKLQTRVQAHWAAFPVLSEIIQRRWEGAFSNSVLDLIFPETKLAEIRTHAQAVQLDPLLFLSLIKQESGFESRAVSASNAYGLSQLIWSTALDMDSTIKRSDLMDEATNLRIGAKYLAQVVKKFDGNWFMALAGYNWGPAAVQRFYKELAGQTKISISGLEFIESIPVKETREYVAAILRNYFWYNRRINKAETLDFNLNWKSPSESKP